MSIQFYSLGAAQEVTGSKHIIEINGRPIMIDCGAFQGKRAEADEKNRTFTIAADKLDAVVLTHAHYDHCGLLPVLTKNGFNGNIYATPATRDLANLIMMDSAHIQARDAEYLKKQAKKKGEKFNWTPLYNDVDVAKTANQIVTVSYQRPMFIANNVSLQFYDAGHILGSAFALLTINDEGKETRILFSGDLGRNEKPIIRNPETKLPAPDYLVLESTYGNRLHEHVEEALDQLAFIVQRVIERRGKLIIPSFAIERTQELIYYFHLLVDEDRIPEIPIYVDSPMATNATSIFQVHPECYDERIHEAFLEHHKNPFGFNALSFISSVEESKALNKVPGPMIIISADGMCEFGRVVHHLANNISNANNTVLLVGYMAENTLGRRLMNGEKEVKIMDEYMKVKAAVENINAFSAHADYKETLDWLKKLDTSRLKKIFLVHGEKDAQEFLQKYLKENGFADIDIVKYGEVYDLN
ncbi:MAG: MBL fold metallo-hydrolase [Spirochaetaceae bacterium]|nr:MBL fold metallo-hydrolase [Spirochaetaceae bacterium]